MKISIVALFIAANVIHGDAVYPNLHSAIVRSQQVGGDFAYSIIQSHGYGLPNPVIQSVARYPQGIGQYPFLYPQVVYPGQPIFGFPGFLPQAPIISPPFISAPQAPPSGSPSQVIVDEDTVAIDSA
ncbi:hypothetical protein FQA39_LY07214 [Lamprigera yunnana]|nr:hypothetical protein FQA39_LY07214 [Lamprigera yunnana]